MYLYCEFIDIIIKSNLLAIILQIGIGAIIYFIMLLLMNDNFLFEILKNIFGKNKIICTFLDKIYEIDLKKRKFILFLIFLAIISFYIFYFLRM